jgi:peptide deformylase
MKNIVVVPYPTLRQISESVVKIDREIKDLIEDLWYALEHSKIDGVGIAAPQVGALKRVFILRDGKKNYKAFINPEIVWKSDETGTGTTKKGDTFLEGCLSIPNFYGPVIRPLAIEVTYLDERGRRHRTKLEEPFSRYVQHEYDHLNGVLFTDHILAQKGKLYVVNEKDELEEIPLSLIAE